MSNIGSDGDAVTLAFNGGETKVFTSYSVRKSILQQPSQFKVRLGWGKVAKDLIKLVPPRTPFQLSINNLIQQTGLTDGFHAQGNATELDISGRDMMQLVHDPYVVNEVAFNDSTFKDLTVKVLKLCGIADPKVASSDAANRKISTGVGLPDTKPIATIDEIEPDTGEAGNKTVRRSIQAKIGETYNSFLSRQLRRAGLFLWAAADGTFILSEPQDNQPACARIVRRRGQPRNSVSATGASWRNETTNRFSEAIVYGRGGGRKFGRTSSKGAFVDDEMFNLGYVRPVVYRDVNVSTQAQAEFYARRKLAEYARAGWQLTYTVPGHTTPSLINGKPMVWAPNTVVEVQDDEYGLHGNYYLEEVVFSRPPTQTTLTLMRLQHLIFASDEE